jgi:hypothetical protein
VKRLFALLGITGAIAGCGSSSGSKPAANTPVTQAMGHPAGTRFVSSVDNPWFPLKPGTTLVYRGVKDGKPSRDVVTVEHATRTIEGVRCTVVTDLLYESGKLEERTTDWYAQDTAGNVWYFGEQTAELYPDGRVKNTSGTWQSGVKGAQAGIYLPANPRVGQTGRQEYYKGEAEDHFQVLRLEASVKVPFIVTKRALLTKEWTPLEPGVLDHKYYVRGVGTVLEQSVKGPVERNLLVSVTHA